MTTPEQTMPDLGSFFSGGGGKTLSWKDKPVGTTYTGVVTNVGAPQHATDPATQKPAFTRQGKPRIQVRIDLKTDYRDPGDPDDDGSRSLYVGGWMTGAIGDAMRKAGAPQGPPQVGATLSVRLSEREDNGPSVAPTNKFDAHYVPPSAAGDFFSQPTAAPAGQALPPLGGGQPQVPTPSFQAGGGYVQQPAAPAAAPAPQTLTPEQMAAFMATPAAPAAAPAAPALVKPNEISQVAWDQMDAATKQAVVNTLGGPNGPPF